MAGIAIHMPFFIQLVKALFEDSLIQINNSPATYTHIVEDLQKKPINPENKMKSNICQDGFLKTTHPYRNQPVKAKDNISPPL